MQVITLKDDFYSEGLQNAIIAGMPFPIINIERRALQEHYEKKYNRKVIYYLILFPVLQSIMQAVGRVMRPLDLNDI